MFLIIGGTAFAGTGGAPRREVPGMAVPFPAEQHRRPPAPANPKGKGSGGAHCRVAARLCRSLLGATGALHCPPARPLRSPSIIRSMP